MTPSQVPASEEYVQASEQTSEQNFKTGEGKDVSDNVQPGSVYYSLSLKKQIIKQVPMDKFRIRYLWDAFKDYDGRDAFTIYEGLIYRQSKSTYLWPCSD